MLGRLDAREWLLWQEYQAFDPIGGERIDAAAALVASTLANQWAEAGRGVSVSDMMPDFGGVRKVQAAKESSRRKDIEWEKAKQEARALETEMIERERTYGRHRPG